MTTKGMQLQPVPAGHRPLPTIYADEQTGPLRASCAACRGRVFVSGAVAGCLLCGRDVAEVMDSRPVPVMAWYAEDQPRKGRPPGKATPAAPTHWCEACGVATSGRNVTGLCLPCAGAAQSDRARQERPSCEACGVATAYRRSARFCAAHLERLEYQRRQHRQRRPCAGGCGADIRAANRSGRCRPCYNAARRQTEAA